MNEYVKIRQVEMNIYQVLQTGIKNTQEIADRLNLTYSAVHSILNRMVMYDIVERIKNGEYGPIEGNFLVGSDTEVIAYRRKKKNGFTPDKTCSEASDPPDEIVEFVKFQYRSNVERNVILARLRSKGILMSKFALNQMIVSQSIEKNYPQRNKSKEVELLNV